MKKFESRGRPRIVLDITYFLSCLEKFENATRKNPYTLKDFASDLKEAPLTTYSFRYSFIKRRLSSYSLKEIEYMLGCKLHSYIYLR